MVLNRKTVLVADPDQSDRNVLAKTLTLAGYRVETAENATDALQVIYRRLVDVAIVDTGLPEIPPGVMVRVIKKTSPHLRIVVISSADSEELEKGMREMGVFHYSIKPLNTEMMEEIVRDAARFTREDAMKMDNELEVFKGVTKSVLADALNVMAEIKEATWPEGESRLLGPDVTGDLPRGGWAELLEKIHLLQHYLDFAMRFCEGDV